MHQTQARGRELRLPAAALANLRRVLREQRGEPAATHLLHDAGFATGPAVHAQLTDELELDPASLSPERFWKELDDFFSERGWGSVRHERIHPGLGALHASDWAESDSDAEDDRPGCAFSAGALAHLLGRIAQGPIAVLEVACRSRGDTRCTFLFGSEEAVSRTYEVMNEGADLEGALARV